MRLPKPLLELVDLGLIQQVIRPLQSGKEAEVFLIVAGGHERVAKVYKQSTNRSFKHRSAYTEGRKVRGTRQQRALDNRSKFGRNVMESSWKAQEVEIMRRLEKAGVRVPKTYDFVDGILIMELIKDSKGNPAPRMVDLSFSREEARELLQLLLRQVIFMLCEGVVHGDLSNFNILMGEDGPVIIDFPQAIDTAHNRNARRMLIRDVNNLTYFLSRYAPELRRLKYGQEMWALYEASELRPDSKLTGKFQAKKKGIDNDALVREIQAAAREAAERRAEVGVSKYAARKAKRAREVAEQLQKDRAAGKSSDNGRSNRKNDQQKDTMRDNNGNSSRSGRYRKRNNRYKSRRRKTN